MKLLLTLFLFTNTLIAALNEPSELYYSIQEGVENKTLSVKDTLKQLAQGELGFEDIPSTFYNYLSPKEDITPLQFLALNGRTVKFYRLLRQWINISDLKIDQKNSMGWTALMLATRHAATTSNRFSVELLLSSKASTKEHTNKGFTLFKLAIDGGHDAIINIIREKILISKERGENNSTD